MPRLLAALLVVAALGACGMKGPLYLPEGESDAPPLKDQGIDPVLDPSQPWDADNLDDPIDDSVEASDETDDTEATNEPGEALDPEAP